MSDLANANHYVYRLYDNESRLIYVGCSHEPEQRIKRHRSTQWWAPQIAKVRVKVYPSRSAGLAAETEARNTEHPRWNIEARWIHRNNWTATMCADYITALENHTQRKTPRYERKIHKALALQREKFTAHLAA
jgi:hypothetical protein